MVDSYTTTIFIIFFLGLTGTIFFVGSLVLYGNALTISLGIIYKLTIASIFVFIALVLLNFSLSNGLAGVSYIITCSSVILTTLIDSIFFNNELQTIQIIGIVLCFFGWIIVSLSTVLSYFQRRNSIKF